MYATHIVQCLRVDGDGEVESERGREHLQQMKRCGPKSVVYTWRGAETHLRMFVSDEHGVFRRTGEAAEAIAVRLVDLKYLLLPQ